MSTVHRIDKVLAHTGFGSRKGVKQIVRSGHVEVNGHIIRNSSLKVDTDVDVITVNGEQIHYREFIYMMLNKPKGVISATEDRIHQTVVDLLDLDSQRFVPFPVGRLDIDTTGFLLLTNDGQLAHELLSPKKRVAKTYAVTVDRPVGAVEKKQLEQGVTLDDGYETLPAIVQWIHPQNGKEVLLTIYEGKFHQVKRMFQAVGGTVTSLKRVQFGPLELDPALKLGDYRELSEAEIKLLKTHSSMI